MHSVQDRSDSEDDEEVHEDARTALPRTPAKAQITRGVLLSSVKKSGPRQSFDIEKYERVNVPRLPSLHLETAPEMDEEHHDHNGPLQSYADDADNVHGTESDENEEGNDIIYEGNSMTLADILLQAGREGSNSVQLLGEGELEDDSSDWE